MRIPHRLSVAALVLVALGMTFVGCSEEEDATRIVVDVVSLNSNSPLFSDVYDTNNTPDDTADDFIPVDLVQVTFRARPHDDVLNVTPGGPFGTVRFTKYSVEFRDGINSTGADLNGDGAVDLENFEAPMSTVVDTFNDAVGYIMLIGGGVKSEFPINQLIFSGEYTADAQITFFGEEETSGDKIEITRGLHIRVANFGDGGE